MGFYFHRSGVPFVVAYAGNHGSADQWPTRSIRIPGSEFWTQLSFSHIGYEQFPISFIQAQSPLFQTIQLCNF